MNRFLVFIKFLFKESSFLGLFSIIGSCLLKNQTILIYALRKEQLVNNTMNSCKNVKIKKGNISELAAYEKKLHFAPWEFRCHNFDGVKDFFVAGDFDSIQHISWIYYEGDPNRMIQLGPRDAEIKYSLTLPEFRGQGLYPQTLIAISRYLIQKGFRNIFICVDATNQASIQGIEKAGFVCLTKIRLVKIMGFQTSKKYIPEEK